MGQTFSCSLPLYHWRWSPVKFTPRFPGWAILEKVLSLFGLGGGMFSLNRLACAIIMFGSLALAQAPHPTTEPITAALRARDFDKAVELSRTALKQSPNNAQLWSLQGIAFASKGESKNALAAFEQALKISPDYLAALAGSAQILYQQGDVKAIPVLNRMLSLRPDDPTAHAMLAVLGYREGKCEAAVGHFERAGDLLAAQLDAQHAYGTCLVRLNRLEDATKVFQRTVSANPDDRRERQLLASVQVMAKKPQDAIATLGPLLQGDSTEAETLELASTAYEDAGNTPQAVSTLRQAILRDPNNVNFYLDFASLCLAHQSFQVGIDVITDGMRVKPDAAKLYLARGVLYVQLADYEKAEADFERAHELDPNQSLSSAAQGLAAVQQNDIGKALDAVQKKLAKKPDDAYLLYLQADFLTQKGVDPGTPEFQKAMQSAKRAVALQPTLASARAVLAKLYLQTGQYPDAIAQCRKALEIDPKDQTTVYRLIQALRKSGQKAEIPGLLKRLAELRAQATQEERERYRYKLVGDEAIPTAPVQSSQP
jgi:tetratricopeptide (TPR) repeat protein